MMYRKVGRNAKLAVRSFVSRAKRLLVGSHVAALLVESKNGLFLVDVQDQIVGGQLSNNGEYGLGELERLQNSITLQSRVLVVGTHIGTLAIPLSRHCADLTAIEANPRTFRLLQLNLLLNSSSNVRAINIAASDERGSIPFLMSRVNSGGSKRAPVRSDYTYVYDSPETVNVQAEPLDKVLAGEKFDVILMDVEGSEYFALKGMPTLLASARVLFLEFVPHHIRNVSGVSVEALIGTLSPHFSTVFIPTRNLRVPRSEFLPVFQRMYDNDEVHDSLEFSK
jgi:FkbM family methyltransferase